MKPTQSFLISYRNRGLSLLVWLCLPLSLLACDALLEDEQTLPEDLTMADLPDDIQAALLDDQRLNKVNSCGGTAVPPFVVLADLVTPTGDRAEAGTACGCNGQYVCFGTGGTFQSNFVYCNASDVCPPTPPTVVSSGVVSFTSISVRASGQMTSSGGNTIAAHGVCVGLAATNPLPSVNLPGSICSNSNTDPGANVFNRSINTLIPSTNYVYRAYVRVGLVDFYHGAAIPFTTRAIGTPVVTATDGTVAGAVNVTWPAVQGAARYEVSINGGAFTNIGLVTFFSDTNPALWSLNGGTAALTNVPPDDFSLAVTGNGLPVGAPNPVRTYAVRAITASSVAGAAGSNTGFAGLGPISLQWERSTTGVAGPFSDLASGTTSPFVDTTAPNFNVFYRARTFAVGASTAFSNVVAPVDRTNGAPCITNSDCDSDNCLSGRCEDINMVLVPGGTFTLGTPASVSFSNQASEAQVQVTLTNDFLINAFEVTQDDWFQLLGFNTRFFSACGGDCPTERVSWTLALRYLNALSVRDGYAPCFDLSGCSSATGRFECPNVGINSTSGSVYDCEGYRLPTDAEWEVAYRAGTSSLLYNGTLVSPEYNTCQPNTFLDLIGWHCGNSGLVTHPVGQLDPNGFGIFDMAGNVSEWTWDLFQESRPANSVNPTGPVGTTGLRITRGGAFNNRATEMHAGRRRERFDQNRVLNTIGFRVVRTAN
jgi:formylglycine-generating enzyme required for sulfatase activity